jgi:hypothetical protein
MLSDLAERAAMCRSQRLFNVLDDRSLLVERASGDDKSFRSSKFLDDVGKLITCPCRL